MSVRRYLAAEPLHAIARLASRGPFAADAVAFTGTARKHPYDPERLVLIADPFSAQTAFYEFRLEDVSQVEELPSLVTETGESITMVRLWVRKGALGLRYEPFIVADTIAALAPRSAEE